MKRIFGMVILMLLCSILVFSSKFDGKWKGVVQTDSGPFEFTVVYKVEGEKLSGSFISD